MSKGPQFHLCNRAASKETAQTELRPDLLTYQDGHFCSKEKSAEEDWLDRLLFYFASTI